MPLEGEQRVIATHTVSVVGDADQLPPACFHINADPGSAGIERVLQQLLNNGSWTLYHLTGCDLIRYLVRKHTDTTHPDILWAVHPEERQAYANVLNANARIRCRMRAPVLNFT